MLVMNKTADRQHSIISPHVVEKGKGNFSRLTDTHGTHQYLYLVISCVICFSDGLSTLHSPVDTI